jgi:hypothetical protein
MIVSIPYRTTNRKAALWRVGKFTVQAPAFLGLFIGVSF